jgi:aerobic-type carbon monoxide dehydrogenase small subunit (CoxS/CutS family)
MEITVNGSTVEVDDPSWSLLDVLRHQLGLISVKDGCSPQGQCGCCTVMVDGQARVACVTPVRRIRGRSVTTVEGLDPARRQTWAEAFTALGASQCGFCTPGIVMRLEALTAAGETSTDDAGQGLLAHLCRCTGWQTILEAWASVAGNVAGVHGNEKMPRAGESTARAGDRDLHAAARRAGLEGGTGQVVGTEVVLGRAGFAADTAPRDALVAVADADGRWVIGPDLPAARRSAGKVQGRRTTAPARWPLDVPDGDWAASLRTTWVDGAYLETDASWCEPGGAPFTVQANGGAFGAKWPDNLELDDARPGAARPDAGESDAGGSDAGGSDAGGSEDRPSLASLRPAAIDVAGAAKRLADEHGRPVLALASREDVARYSRKRPPMAGAMTDDGRARFRVAATPGIAEAILAGLEANRRWAFPALDPDHPLTTVVTVDEVEVPGPPTSARVRAAGWAEAVVLAAGAVGHRGPIRAPNGAEAEAEVDPDAVDGDNGVIRVSVRCGAPLDEVVLRSYCVGAAHMAWSWLTAESMLVDEGGTVHDLTIRSLGVLRAVDTPRIEVAIELDGGGSGSGEAVNGSDAVFAAVAAAGWQALGCPRDWPASAVSPAVSC